MPVCGVWPRGDAYGRFSEGVRGGRHRTPHTVEYCTSSPLKLRLARRTLKAHERLARVPGRGGTWADRSAVSPSLSRGCFAVPSCGVRTLAGVRRFALIACAVALVLAPIGAQAAPRGDPGPYTGLGTWVDVYDTPAYTSPSLTAAKIAARHVRTVYVETTNDRSTVDVVNPKALGLFVDALRAKGINVVAWYLPGFVKPALDARRTRAMLSFRTPKGAAFDGVALDIESLSLKRTGLRTARLLALSRLLRAEAGDVPVAAITYPSRFFERHPTWWPRFPWQQLTVLVDAWIPMTYTGTSFPGYDATYGYVARSLRLLRDAVGPDIPIHAAGGVANRMTVEELKAFADAVADEGTVSGWSLYDFHTTGPKGWAALEALGGG
jgi:hypothetical protein